MFYFKPPRGNIHLQQLQECVVARMIYFLRMDNRTYNKSAEQCSDFEHMFSGTPMDRTGHFVLRLLMSGAQQLTEFFIRSEAKLFIERINSLSTKDLLQFLKTSIRHVEELLKSTEHHTRWLNTAVEVLKYIYSSALKSHYISFHHDESCSQHMLTVPFEYCLPLVKKREINLIRGNGKVPCGKWKKLVESLFYYHLDFSLKDIASQNDLLIEVNCDQRLLDLKKTLKQMYYNSVEVENNRMDESIIYATEVEELSSYFPPCMSVLYTNLKAKHRLGHQARFSFSLYLKDIGMPVKESIQFWKHEYLKPKNCSNSGCTHSWQRDSAKFEYNIRHMYGLEGSRNNYSAPSCLKIHCSVLGPASEGGCPFIHFDEKSLALFLNPEVTADEEVYNNIVQLKINRKPEDACFLYSKTLAQTKCPNAKWNYETLHKNPVQFYNRVKNSVSEYVQSNHRK